MSASTKIRAAAVRQRASRNARPDES
jgi:hypothetical protein